VLIKLKGRLFRLLHPFYSNQIACNFTLNSMDESLKDVKVLLEQSLLGREFY